MVRETILKFIERKASLEEQKEVLAWLEASEENRKEFAVLKNLSVAMDIIATDKVARKGSVRRLLVWSAKIAAVLVAAVSLFLLGECVQEYKLRQSAAQQFTEITAPYGEVLHFNLPDGSKVILNSGSTLKFSKLFNEEQRDIYLSGEGYFEVKKDEKRFNVVYPIESPIFKLSVLGTTFNISSYPDNKNVVTTLYDGSIEIEDLNSHENFKLKPHYQHIYEKNTGVSTVEPFNETYRWTDKYVVAKGEDISTFTRRLEKIFNVKIIIDNDLIGNCSYSGALYGGSLQQILDNMTYVSPIKYSIKDSGKTIIIESK